MVKVYSIDGVTPVIDPTAFVHPSAVLIGDVIVGPGVFIGPCASLRGDFGRLVIRAGANFQDCCVMHSFPGGDCVVEEEGHIGHGAILHGCLIKRNAMVGMNAVVMDRAVVGESALVAASCLVGAGMEIPPRTLVAGVPGSIFQMQGRFSLGYGSHIFKANRYVLDGAFGAAELAPTRFLRLQIEYDSEKWNTAVGLSPGAGFHLRAAWLNLDRLSFGAGWSHTL